MAKINLKTLVESAVHNPSVEDTIDGNTYKFPLYRKVNDSAASENSDMETRASKSAKYQQAIKHTYSSPTNIRRVFITHSGVRVDYFHIPVNNANDSSLTKTRTFNTKNTDGMTLIQLLGKKATYQADMQRYNMERTTNKDAEKPKEISFTGNPLGIVSGMYALNNLEELYIDWTLFLSEDTAPYVQQVLGYTNHPINLAIDMAKRELSGALPEPQNGIIKNRSLLKLLTATVPSFNMDRYPRLKAIGFIQGLHQIIGHKTDISNLNLLSHIQDEVNNWADLNSELIKQYGGVSIVSSFKRAEDTFVNKKDTYYFDAEKLTGFIAAYTKKRNDLIRESHIKNSMGTTDTVDNTTSELEKSILEIEKAQGEGFARLAFQAATACYPVNTLKMILSGFSTPNRIRMSKWAGIKL